MYITCPPGVTCVCDAVFLIDRSDLRLNSGQISDALLLRSGSKMSLVTVALLRRSSQSSTELATFAVTVNVCDAPGASDATEHVTVLFTSAHPLLADTNDRPLGSGSDARMLIAVLGPLLVTFNEYVSFVPGTTGVGDADFSIFRSACALLVTLHV